MNGSNEGLWVETVDRTLCYEMPPTARRIVVRAGHSAAPLIDIRGYERSKRERSDEAAFSHLGGSRFERASYEIAKSVD